MKVNPGDLNKRISILSVEKRLDQDGYSAEQEVVVHTCWAQFSRTSGTEIAKADADFGEVKARFLIRHTKKEINRKMRVRYAGAVYEIVYVNDYGDEHEYSEIWCERVTKEANL